MSDSNVPPVPPVPQVPPVPGQPGQPGQQPPTQAYPQQPNPTAPTAPYGQPPQFGGQPPQFGGPQGPQGPGFGGPQGPGGPGFGGPQGPGAPYGQPPQGGGDSKKLLWIILAGVGVLLIAAAIVWAFVAGPFSGGGDNKSDKETTAPSTEPKPGKSDKPKADKGSDDTAVGVVKSYLNALAEGDAATAIGYLESKPSGDLVTEEMLKASIEIAPITDIEVEDNDYRVTATFKVGGEEVSMDLSTRQSGKKYKISKYSLGSVYLFGTAPTSGLEVNGIAFSAPTGSGSIDAFPILYRFSSTSKYIQLSGTTDVIAYDMSTMVDVDASVTEEGQTVARDAVKASVAACLAEKTLASSCGMDVTSPLSGGETVAEGSVTRVLPSSEQSQLDNLTLDPDYSNPLLLSTYKSFRPDITATCTNTSGATGTCSIIKFGGSKSPVVDLSKDPVTVTWE